MNRVIPNEALTARAPSGQRPTDAELLALPDAEVRAEPLARLGNPPSYVALGQRYEVLKSSKGFVERGVASWYGPNFHGEKASIGEPYNMYAMTGAHRVLPLPCYARVTNLKNGRSVVVRLNDRGPFKDNRIVDLSYAAALKLDMLREGTALVELRVLEPNGANTAAAPAVAPLSPLNPMKLYAQVGAFSDKNNAEHLKTQLEPLNLGPIVLTHEITASKDLYKVRIGPIDSVSGYDKVAAALKVAGHSVSLVDGELKK
jgi:rare lipoprotein A